MSDSTPVLLKMLGIEHTFNLKYSMTTILWVNEPFIDREKSTITTFLYQFLQNPALFTSTTDDFA